ncbi:hypothetical protein P7K49_013943, partial [Saguinus oedipus]
AAAAALGSRGGGGGGGAGGGSDFGCSAAAPRSESGFLPYSAAVLSKTAGRGSAHQITTSPPPGGRAHRSECARGSPVRPLRPPCAARCYRCRQGAPQGPGGRREPARTRGGRGEEPAQKPGSGCSAAPRGPKQRRTTTKREGDTVRWCLEAG